MKNLSCMPVLFIALITGALSADDSGGLNLNAHCAKLYNNSRAVLVDDSGRITKQNQAPNRAYGWRCAVGGKMQSIDMEAACRDQHGNDARASAAPDDAYSWKCVRGGAPVTPPASGEQVEYQNYKGQKEMLYAYPAADVVLFTPFRIADGDQAKILGHVNQCAVVYKQLTPGGWPRNGHKLFPGKASVAVVKATCGAGCGSGGRAEIQVAELKDAEKRMGSLSDPLTWQVGYYELGRSGSSRKNPAYPLYPALDPSNGHDVIASAYPEFVMSVCADRMGIHPALYQESYQRVGYPRNQSVAEHMRQFQATKLTFVQALEKDRKGYYRGWVLSGLLYDIYREFGYENTRLFMQNAAEIAAEKGQVKDIPGVAENILEAARRTAGATMVDYLRRVWRL